MLDFPNNPVDGQIYNAPNGVSYVWSLLHGAWDVISGPPAQFATNAEAITGTEANKALSPATGVAKDAPGMSGAAVLPGGDDASRPGTPITGMLRYNDENGTPANLEYYDGVSWNMFSLSGSIKSIQRGVISIDSGSISESITISEVNPNKSILYHLGNSTGFSGGANAFALLTLDDSTTITATSNYTSTTGVQISYQLVEYY